MDEDMLVLSRKKGERILIGDNISIVVVEVKEGRVKLGIEAPKDTTVHRQEIYDMLKAKEKSGG